MNALTCYYAVFNVGEIDVWDSELYLDKDAIFAELEESKEEIAERIDAHSYDYHFDYDSDSNEPMLNMLDRDFAKLLTDGFYKERENQLDFFILSRNVYNDRQEYQAEHQTLTTQ